MKLSKFFNLNKPAKLTSLDFPFNDNNIFKFNINYYNNLLQSSNELNKYMFDNIWLLHQNTESKTFKPLNNIIDDLKLFENIQSNLIKLIEHQNTYKDSINLINNHIQDYNLQYQFSKDELYNNQFNNKLFEELNRLFGLELHLKYYINNFNNSKLKEFYVLNDLDYLNVKNNKIIDIELFNNFRLFKNYMNDNIETIIREPSLFNSMEFIRMNSLYKSFILDFDIMYNSYDKSTLNNIDSKYDNNMKFKSIDNLKKTRIIQYYAHLFNIV